MSAFWPNVSLCDNKCLKNISIVTVCSIEMTKSREEHLHPLLSLWTPMNNTFKTWLKSTEIDKKQKCIINNGS